MLESWILPLGIVAVFAILLLAPLAESRFPRTRRRSLVCPWAGSEVSVEFVERVTYGAVDGPDVRACSAFRDPENPTCDKGCLRRLDLR